MISARRLCAKVAFAVKGDFYTGEGTGLGFNVCSSSAMDLIQFCIYQSRVLHVSSETDG